MNTNPTVVGTNTQTVQTSQTVTNGTTVITTTVTRGVTTRVVTTDHTVSENATHQTVETTVTTVDTTPVTVVTTNTTPVTTTTCTVNRTTTTYSDNTSTTNDSAQNCSSTVSNTVTSTTSTTDEVITDIATSNVSGRIDQLVEFNNYNYILNSSLGRDLFRRDWITTENGRMYINVNNNRSTFDNGYKVNGQVYGVGVEKDINAVTVVGLRANRANSNLNGTDSVSRQQKDHFAVYGTKRTEVIDLHADLNFAKNNYGSTRHIGPYSNSLSTSGTDTWITVSGSKEVMPGVTPYLGVTTGKQKIDGYTESGSALTARTVNGISTNLNYATTGVNISKDVEKVNLSVTASANTDNLQTIKISVDTFADEKIKLSISATETRYKNIRNTSVGIGLNVKF
jgi:hypothetical protein